MKLYRHRDYEEYRQAQIAKNVRKFERVFVTVEEVETIARLVPRPVEFGLCHGVRNGWEVRAFQAALGAGTLLGTDISPTAATVDSCIQWDFHDVDPAWIGRVDFLYSNALDHSYDPGLCLSRWVSCLSPRGMAVVTWEKGVFDLVDRADCFKARPEEIASLIRQKGRLVRQLQSRGRTHFFFTAARTD